MRCPSPTPPDVNVAAGSLPACRGRCRLLKKHSCAINSSWLFDGSCDHHAQFDLKSLVCILMDLVVFVAE